VHLLFVSDLHGKIDRYRKLFAAIEQETPRAVLLGGDLLPHGLSRQWADTGGRDDFLSGFLVPEVERLRRRLGPRMPRLLLILGNDDDRAWEAAILDAATRGLWEYVHDRRVDLDGVPVYGYACIPPSPFQLKDWERYDISRYVDPGAISPEEGVRTVPVSPDQARDRTIARDLADLTADDDLSRAILLLHAPPYRSALDRAALDGQMVDHVPLDVHIGSIAVERLIKDRQPAVTLHGHVHESARLTGTWRDTIGRTHCLSAAHDGPELALVRLDPARPEDATRELL
jgi:Icc-related predicted phosphoesterase